MDICAPVPVIDTIRSILNDPPLNDEGLRRFEGFCQHLSRLSFRPQPNQMTTLPIVGALQRWADLKTAVQRQLTKNIVSKWEAFENTPEDIRWTAQANQNQVTTDECIQGQPPEPARKAAPPRITAPGTSTEPVLAYAKRDWFDCLLDFVGIFVNPFLGKA